MFLLAAAGFNQDELLRLNRVQIHQQVLFLSCILGASGKTLDARYLKRRPPGERWSRLRFPRENPPAKDFRLWERALKQLVPAGGITDRLRQFQHEGYKIWPWRFNASSARLLRDRQDGFMDVYRRVEGMATRSTARWELREEEVAFKDVGKICTVRNVKHEQKVVMSAAEPPRPREIPMTILEVLEEWGCTWMWNSLRLVGDDYWLEDAIAAGTCRAVTVCVCVCLCTGEEWRISPQGGP